MENEPWDYGMMETTVPGVEYDKTETTRALVMIILHSIFAVLLTVFNGVLIIVILFKRKLRSSPKYFIVLNLSVVGFIEGVFVNPVLTVVWHQWHHRNFPCILAAPVDTILSAFPHVDMMLSISMCIQWIASITIPSYKTKPRFRLVLFLTVLSWLTSLCLSLAVVIPVSTSSISYHTFGCAFFFEGFSINVLRFVISIPLWLLLIIILILLFVVRLRQRRGRYNTVSNRKKFPLDIVLCIFIMLCCIGSLICTNFLTISTLAMIIVSRFEMARHILTPLIWLIGSNAIKRGLLCKEHRARTETHELTTI